MGGKRSAEADAEPGYYGLPYYGYPYGFYGYPYYHAVKPLKAGTAVHPGLATSFVERSPQGAKAKRSAEPGYYGYPYGYYGYPYLRYHALKPLKAGTAVHP